MMRMGKFERRTCPEEFQERLTMLGGVNFFGEPNFRMIWGQTETMLVARADGRGYIEKTIGYNQPVWILQQWKPPELYGTPEQYYVLTADPLSGAPLLGEYPQFGRYETMISFLGKKYDEQTQALEISTIDLGEEFFDHIFPLLLHATEMTDAQKLAAIEQEEADENAEIVTQIAERLCDDLPTFYGPTSYAQQTQRTSLIDRKKAEIERNWKRLGVDKRKIPARGFYQGAPL